MKSHIYPYCKRLVKLSDVSIGNLISISDTGKKVLLNPDLGFSYGSSKDAFRLLNKSQSVTGLTITPQRFFDLVASILTPSFSGHLFIVALCSGDARREIDLAERLKSIGIPTSLVAIDISATMLVECLRLASIKRISCFAIQADVLRDPIRHWLDDNLPIGTRLFSMIGGTFGNYSMARIIPAIGRLTRKKDYVVVEAATLSDNKIQNDSIRQRYGRLNYDLVESLWPGLRALGFTKNNAIINFYKSKEQGLALPVATYQLVTTKRVPFMKASVSSICLSPKSKAIVLEQRIFSRRSLHALMRSIKFAFAGEAIGDATTGISAFVRI